MDIFLAPFMRQKYPEEKLAFEWTYMLLSVLEENEKDNHLTLFHKILIGDVSMNESLVGWADMYLLLCILGITI